jgi:hypothetical protein
MLAYQLINILSVTRLRLLLAHRAGCIISVQLLTFLQGSDCCLILTALLGASHSVVTGASSLIARLPTALPTQMVGAFTVLREVFDRDYSLKPLTVYGITARNRIE